MQSETRTVVARGEFTRPVEHVMRCDDFKSNFARKLSTRYTSTSAHSPTPTPASRIGNQTHIHDNASAKIEPRTELSESVSKEEKLGAVAVVSAAGRASRGEGATLNMEVDTLRWQLTQTEANRQMHIALLRQVVSFLNRVKEHIEFQKEERSGEMTTRARSVLHPSASLLAVTSPDHTTWNDSMLILPSENNSNQKMSEEISRLVCLANTVLGTELPELSCRCADREERMRTERVVRPRSSTFDEDADDITPMKGSCAADTIGSLEFSEATTTTKTLNMIQKRNDYEQYSFIEDESGFSSMSSFQEIGIPIISIIPASPCEEMSARASPVDDSLEDDSTTATSTATSTAAHSVHVFWV